MQNDTDMHHAHMVPMCPCHAIVQYQQLSFHDCASMRLSQMQKAAVQKEMYIPLVAESKIQQKSNVNIILRCRSNY